MRGLIFTLLFIILLKTKAQELFVSTKPASNISARSISLIVSDHYAPNDAVYDRPANRFMPELNVGLSKKIMLSAGGSFSNMHTYKFKPESIFGYVKYRFLAHDDMHKHFRMAAFVQGSHTIAPFHYDEIGLTGDKSGIEGGVIATQLWNRFALSGSVSHVQLLDKSRFNETVYLPERVYEAMNYSLSSGYLFLPIEYKSYKQLGVNLYFELLAQQALDKSAYFIDAAPAVQFILFSNTKLNACYRLQLSGDAQRMSKTSWLFTIERNFLNVWKAKAK